ncbi:MAG TPA: histidine phosphatase family protein [Candidatus Stackebrandtia faecavium]|nr:histidine phosphatase family protein [Candidatus Stackebrandtia faecavium]
MSNPKTVVHLLRHGEVHNPERVLYGRMPGFGLSELGHHMAKVAAESLRDNDITHIVSSPLQRAQETAAPILQLFDGELATDEKLIEPTNYFEGMRVSVGDGALRNPRHWWTLRDPLTPSWGEPYLDIARRMTAALQRARHEAEGHEAVCVSHQLPIWTLRSFMTRRRLWHDPRKRECSLASLTSFHFDGSRLTDVTYSEPAKTLVASSPNAAQSKGA